MDFTAIIPARYASTRLPGKPLLDIAGKPMVVRVAERAQASGAARTLIATDDERIAQAAKAHGFEALMTSAAHATGTDRLAEVATRLELPDDRVVVNVQGDEPLIEPSLIAGVAAELARHPQAAIATVAHPIADRDSLLNPNVVKVVLDGEGYALYFSRAPIPFARDAEPSNHAELPHGLPALRHIGLYAYRVGFLKGYGRLSTCAIEQFEALEQLRALWHGHRIAVSVVDHPPLPGVDTPADLERVRALFS